MVRRNFADRIAETGVDIGTEITRLAQLFYVFTIQGEDNLTIEKLVSQYFIKLPVRKTCITLEDFNHEYGFDFKSKRIPSLDYLLDFCEYGMNLTEECRVYLDEYSENITMSSYDRQMGAILTFQNHIDTLIDKIHHKEIIYNGYICYVEENPAAVSASEILEGQISLETLRYNHHSMKGDLVAKRKMLVLMADWIEPKEKELADVNNRLKTNLFSNFNNFNIRHNNKEEGKKFNPILKDITDAELEEIYDDTYQLWLLAVLTLDNRERQKKYEEMRKESK